MPATRFGQDHPAQIGRWFQDEFREDLETKYGERADTIVVVVLPPIALHHFNWRSPLDEVLYILEYGSSVVIESLIENIAGKFRFTLRTGLPSSQAHTRPDLVEPGDFPWAGAQIYRGYPVGVSALVEESDVWVGERVVDELIVPRSLTGERAIRASRAGVPGWKFLDGDSSKLLGPATDMTAWGGSLGSD